MAVNGRETRRKKRALDRLCQDAVLKLEPGFLTRSYHSQGALHKSDEASHEETRLFPARCLGQNLGKGSRQTPSSQASMINFGIWSCHGMNRAQQQRNNNPATAEHYNSNSEQHIGIGSRRVAAAAAVAGTAVTFIHKCMHT